MTTLNWKPSNPSHEPPAQYTTIKGYSVAYSVIKSVPKHRYSIGSVGGYEVLYFNEKLSDEQVSEVVDLYEMARKALREKAGASE